MNIRKYFRQLTKYTIQSNNLFLVNLILTSSELPLACRVAPISYRVFANVFQKKKGKACQSNQNNVLSILFSSTYLALEMWGTWWNFNILLEGWDTTVSYSFLSHWPSKFLRTEWLLSELLWEQRWALVSTRSWGGVLQEWPHVWLCWNLMSIQTTNTEHK